MAKAIRGSPIVGFGPPGPNVYRPALFFWGLRQALNILGCFIRAESQVRLYSLCVMISGLWSHLGSGGLERGGLGGDLMAMKWMASIIGDFMGSFR